MPPRRSPFDYNAASGRYHDARGRFVPRAQVVRALALRLDAAKARVTTLAVSLRESGLSLGAWESQMRDALYEVHAYAAMAQRGGVDRMDARAWGMVGQELRRQYRFLRRMADEIAAGMPLDGRFTRRVELYGLSGIVSSDKAQTDEMERLGYDEERNVLHEAEHCAGCLAQTARGWVPIGELSPLGSRDCLTHEKCTKEFRNSRTGRIAA